MSWIRNLRIRAKIVIAFLGFSVLICAIIGPLSIYFIRAVARHSLDGAQAIGAAAIADSKEALLRQSEQGLLRTALDQSVITDLYLQRVETEIGAMSGYHAHLMQDAAVACPETLLASGKGSSVPSDPSANVAYALAPGVSLAAVKDELTRVGQMTQIFRSVARGNPSLRLVFVGTESGIMLKYPWAPTPAGYDPRQRDWYKKAVEAKGEIIWSDPYVAASYKELVLSCSKALYDRKGRLAGVVAADVSVKSLAEELMSAQRDSGGVGIVLDRSGNVIARAGMEAGARDWRESYATENLLTGGSPDLRAVAREMVGGASGIRTCEVSGDRQYIAYAPVPTPGWSVGIIMPVAGILAPATATEGQIEKAVASISDTISRFLAGELAIYAGIFAAMLGGVFLVGIWLSNLITRPILVLAEGTNRIGTGDLDHEISLATGDELESLADDFNRMTRDLKQYIKNLEETLAEKHRIESDIKIAREIQVSLLPRIFPAFPTRREIDVFASMDSAKEVGGDLYDFFLVDENRMFFAIADVSGKGVSASLFMAVVKTLMKSEAHRLPDPAQVLFNLNNSLAPENEACMFVTVFCGFLDLSNGHVRYCNGGHNPPLIYKRAGTYEYIGIEQNFVVGPMSETPYTAGELDLAPGDALFLYTDGVTEAMNPAHELYGEEKLQERLSSLLGEDMKGTISGVRAAVAEYASGEPQSDDITMVAIRYCGHEECPPPQRRECAVTASSAGGCPGPGIPG